MSKSWHKEALRLYIEGFSGRGIARKIGMSKSQVNDYLKPFKQNPELIHEVVDKNTSPNVLLFDIETSLIKGYVWGLWNQNLSLAQIEEDWYVICWSAKWLGEHTVFNSSIHDYEMPHTGRYKDNERLVVEALWQQLDDADIVVAYNGKMFDKKKMNWKFFEYGLPEPSPYKVIDPMLIIKGNFNNTSRKMDFIAQYVDELESGKHSTNIQLWIDCMNDDVDQLDYMVNYCITPDHKLLKDDLRWYEARDLKVGDKVLGFDEVSTLKSRRLFRESTVTSINYDIQPVYEVKLSSGKIFKVTKEHKWLAKSSKFGGAYGWVTTEDFMKNPQDYIISKVMNVWDEYNTKDAGWLAGMFDGEGCLSYRGERLRNGLKPITGLSIAQRPTKVFDRLETLLSGYYGGYNKRITNQDSDCISIDLRGCKYHKLEFLGRIRPERLVDKVKFDQLGSFEGRAGDETIVSVTPIGEQEIIKISTDTGTFICDGYAHHNCDQDIEVLEKVYLAVRHWDKNAPQLSMYYDDDLMRCNSCGSTHLSKLDNKAAYTTLSKFEIYRCDDCSKIMRGRDNMIPKESRKKFIMNVS